MLRISPIGGKCIMTIWFMKKYWKIINTEWQRQLTYRLEFFGFRLGNFLEIAVQLIIWTIIFRQQDIIRGYNYNEMMTYIIVGWLFLFLTGNYGFEEKVSTQIKDGHLSNFLTKPIGYLRYIVAVSIGRISLALGTSILIIIIFIAFYHKVMYFPENILVIPLIIAMLFFGYFIKLFLSILMGFLAFWTTEIYGFHYSFGVLSKLLSGAYFPLGLIGGYTLQISLIFPFAYTFYFPVQLYLEKISLLQGLKGLGIEILWLFALYAIIKLVWKKGLKKYESVGI